MHMPGAKGTFCGVEPRNRWSGGDLGFGCGRFLISRWEKGETLEGVMHARHVDYPERRYSRDYVLYCITPIDEATFK